MDEHTNIPVMLEVAGRRCVVVGAGPVGARRAKTLVEAQADVVVIAPDIKPSLIRLADEKENLKLVRRGFQFDDLSNTLLVVIASNNERANGEARRSAIHHGVLMDGAHAKRGSDVTFMGSERRGPLTIAVHTGGASASAAKQIRKGLVEHLDPDWPILLQEAIVAREALYPVRDPNLRRHAMLQLADDLAMRTLKEKGTGGLQTLYRDIVKQACLADQAQ